MSDSDLALVDRATGELVATLDATLPALSFDSARELLPRVDAAIRYLDRLRAFAFETVEDDCRRNARTEVLIGDRPFVFRGATAYHVDDPAGLRAKLAARVTAGELTPDELDAAVAVEPPPPPVATYHVHNGRLNALRKRGGAVLAAIAAHQTSEETPAVLKPKGR